MSESALGDLDRLAQEQRDELRGTVMGRRYTVYRNEHQSEYAWPDVPQNKPTSAPAEKPLR